MKRGPIPRDRNRILSVWRGRKKEKLEFRHLISLVKEKYPEYSERSIIRHLGQHVEDGKLRKAKKGRRTWYWPLHEEDVIKAGITDVADNFPNDEVLPIDGMTIFGVNLEKLTAEEKQELGKEIVSKFRQALERLRDFKNELLYKRMHAAWEKHVLNADIDPLIKWLCGYYMRWLHFSAVNWFLTHYITTESNAPAITWTWPGIQNLDIHAWRMLNRELCQCGEEPLKQALLASGVTEKEWLEVKNKIDEELINPKVQQAVANFTLDYLKLFEDFDPERLMFVCFEPPSGSWADRHMFRLYFKFLTKTIPEVHQELKEFLDWFWDKDKIDNWKEIEHRLKSEETKKKEFENAKTVFSEIFELPDLRSWTRERGRNLGL